MIITPYHVASSFVGTKEIVGGQDNPLVLAMLQEDTSWPQHDEVPWCSAFINFVCKLLSLPRSHSLAARSWLTIGTTIKLEEATKDCDVVVLERGAGGHVGFFDHYDPVNKVVYLLAGNQSNEVDVAPFPVSRILGVRRLI